MAIITHKSVTSPTETPYQLDPDQTLKASQALLRHVQAEAKKIKENSNKRNLLEDDGSDSDGGVGIKSRTPIWLNLTTKQHITDRNKLAPSKIPVPHPIYQSENLNLCLITADPQRAVKDVVADEKFPAELATNITKIIGFTKLKERYKTFEQRRQLFAEHDMFLADDRIVSRLPGALGKVFYDSTAKRPVSIRIDGKNRVDGKRAKASPRTPNSSTGASRNVASPEAVAREIEKAVNSIQINLKPGTSVAVRVGLISFTAEELSENISIVTTSLIGKHVAKGWRNVKSIYIKSPTSLAVPIWLADELWAEKGNIEAEATEQREAIEGVDQKKRKRKPNSKNGPQSGPEKRQRRENEDTKQEQDLAMTRKLALAAQKAKVLSD